MAKKNPEDAGLPGTGVDGVTLNPSVDPNAEGGAGAPAAESGVDADGQPNPPAPDPEAPAAAGAEPDAGAADEAPVLEPVIADPGGPHLAPCLDWRVVDGVRVPVLNGEVVLDQAERAGITCLVTTGGRKIFLATVAEYEGVYGVLSPDARARVLARYPNAG